MENQVNVFKALSDKNRLLILDMLSCGEMCACDIEEVLGLSQSTISHHMKILQQAKLVTGNKVGKWMHYSINKQEFDNIFGFIKVLINNKDNCICKKASKNCDS